ncbi:MAG: type III-A CRISPR-associated RAMP protein Csm4 [Tannerellaceae bacterium]|jgi:CRISPR-associated protein Csm4|nr:type III-A CRISPR-associated RAMP protein Csm4 [Tannerellaceae bacterium]
MKDTFLIYKLHFTTPLHLGYARGDYSVSLKTVASDTMYAALTSCLAKLGKEIPEDGDLGFTVSSLFPFYQKNEGTPAVYFFPKGYKKSKYIKSDTDNEVSNAKDIKKVQWLDLSYFEKRIALNENIYSESEHIKGEYLTDKAIDKDFITSQVSPRVTVSRAGENATPFYMDRIFFKDYSGLYFIVKGDRKLLDMALGLLQYEGIGTDRNVGNGLFTYTSDKIEINLPDNNTTEYAMSLSMFIPSSKKQLAVMLAGEKVGYDFLRRGGWITTPPFNTKRKNIIYAFTSGSVFSMKMDDNVAIHGKIVDLKPDIEWEEGKVEHSIWRNGKALFIPVIV